MQLSATLASNERERSASSSPISAEQRYQPVAGEPGLRRRLTIKRLPSWTRERSSLIPRATTARRPSTLRTDRSLRAASLRGRAWCDAARCVLFVPWPYTALEDDRTISSGNAERRARKAELDLIPHLLETSGDAIGVIGRRAGREL
jgi:hypothetical protein